MNIQYQKDGKIFSSLLAVDFETGATIQEYETCNQVNEFAVKCEFCNKEIKPGKATSNSGNYKTGEITSWSCQKCDNDSEAAYQRSCFDVDVREAQLSEMGI